ncbi:MAG: hypothetical protein IPM91_22615 [Bacteroidetes bacterium]|nr:hypothetical protein [Bacteroidota bacterium]
MVFFFRNGQIQNEDNYKNGMRNGKYTIYYENGKSIMNAIIVKIEK